MKRIVMILLAALLIFAMTACDEGNGNPTATTETPGGETAAPDTTAPEADETTGAAGESSSTPDESITPDESSSTPDATAPEGTTSEIPSVGGIDKTGWEAMLNPENFTNYTFKVTGTMTAMVDGQNQGVSNIDETIMVTADKVKITALAYDTESDASDDFSVTLSGKEAEAQITQYTQIFMPILSRYESFVYDAETGTYSINDTVAMDVILIGISYSHDGTISTFEAPAHLEFSQATATLSEDGKLATFVCNYSQSMTTNGYNVVTDGTTTWTFSNFGTTVIED